MSTPIRNREQDNRVVCGDNLALMRTLPAGCCDLIYVDPPFCTGRSRRTSKHAARFDDGRPDGLDGYLASLSERLEQMHRLLPVTGTLYVHLDWRAVHYVRVKLDKIFGYENFLNEIIWSYRTGGTSRQWFGRKHDTILVYAKQRGKHTFHVTRDGQFRTDGLKYDEAGRPYKSTKRGRLYFHADGPALTDVWDIPFLSTVSLERTGYPAQKPEALLERIITAASNEGDLVADFYCGSGTTAVVAARLGRRWLCCDSSPDAVRIAHDRLACMTPGNR